tara:strand:- start:1610 stop:2104 length:495 start_codon:yes stop_codon:yes gene_type:complete
MKSTALFMAAALLILMGLALAQGGGTFREGMATSGRQLIRFLPILIIAVLLAGFMETLLPQRIVDNLLSDTAGFKGIVIAWFAGIITPGGSIVGMPIIAGLYRAGVGTAVLMTYATSLATLSLMRVPIEAGFYGWRLTALRIGVSLGLPFIAGGLTLLFVRLTE